MIYALIHHPGETIGLIENVVKALGLPFREIHLWDGDGLPRNTSDLEGLIVMGGPMNVDEVTLYPYLKEEALLIEKVISDNKPVLGICLGSQLIAKALGQKIFKNKYKEIGWQPVQLTKHAAKDPLFKTLPDEMTVLHWHGDTYDLPKGAVHLAQTKKCKNQAFRIGEKTYGLQFHFEVTANMAKAWTTSEEGKKEVASAGEKPDEILDVTPQAAAALKPHAEKFFKAYFQAAYPSLLQSH